MSSFFRFLFYCFGNHFFACFICFFSNNIGSDCVFRYCAFRSNRYLLFILFAEKFIVHNQELLCEEHYDKVSSRIYHNSQGQRPTFRIGFDMICPERPIHQSVLYRSLDNSRTEPQYYAEQHVHSNTECKVMSGFEQDFSM